MYEQTVGLCYPRENPILSFFPAVFEWVVVGARYRNKEWQLKQVRQESRAGEEVEGNTS